MNKLIILLLLSCLFLSGCSSTENNQLPKLTISRNFTDGIVITTTVSPLEGSINTTEFGAVTADHRFIHQQDVSMVFNVLTGIKYNLIALVKTIPK